MPKKQYYIVVDSETTQATKTEPSTVADFGAVICDRQGVIYNHIAVLVKDHFDKRELFYTSDTLMDGFWNGKKSEQRRRAAYEEMLNDGRRMLASVTAINNWLQKAIGTYGSENLHMTAYNLAFDVDKFQKTGIDISGFNNRFCLWQAALGNIVVKRAYKQFILDNHLLCNVTDLKNCSFKTSAESVASFIKGECLTEPHQAYEDCLIERDILVNVMKHKKWRDKMISYDWRKTQLRDHFIAK
jgi:hypothetical protein